jgi:hypothetical protein
LDERLAVDQHVEGRRAGRGVEDANGRVRLDAFVGRARRARSKGGERSQGEHAGQDGAQALHRRASSEKSMAVVHQVLLSAGREQRGFQTKVIAA